jgi:hypothetical protein
MPPTPVSGAPRTSHDAADTPGMKSDHRSRSMRTSYTDAGVAVDGCSTLIDTAVGTTRKTTTAVQIAGAFAKDVQGVLKNVPTPLSETHRVRWAIPDTLRCSRCRLTPVPPLLVAQVGRELGAQHFRGIGKCCPHPHAYSADRFKSPPTQRGQKRCRQPKTRFW